MKRFIEGECRAQSTLLPERLDDWIADDNPVRAVDAFVDLVDHYERLRLEAYKRIASIRDDDQLAAVRDELVDRYGQLPDEVRNLLEVAAFRNLARAAGLAEVVVAGKQIRFGPVELRESQELKVKRLYPGTLVKPALRTILVPRPATARIGGQPLRDLDLLAWARGLVTEILTPLARSEGKG